MKRLLALLLTLSMLVSVFPTILAEEPLEWDLTEAEVSLAPEEETEIREETLPEETTEDLTEEAFLTEDELAEDIPEEQQFEEETEIAVFAEPEEILDEDFAELPEEEEEVNPESVTASGTCGDKITWELDDKGTLTLTGTGETKNWSRTTFPWVDYKDSITKVVIGSGITQIGMDAFRDCTALKEVVLPATLRKILDNAFGGCTGLTGITLPAGLETIGFTAFRETGITEIAIPASVTTIGDGILAFSKKPTAITVASGNSSYVAVDGVLFTKDMKTLMQYPGGKTDTRYTIPYGVETINDYAFAEAQKLTEIIFPESVKQIRQFAVYNCPNLKQVTLPESLEQINQYAFSLCRALDTITIPGNVKAIYNGAFRDCSGLTQIYFRGKPETMDDNIFVHVTATALYFPAHGWTDQDLNNYGGTLTWAENYSGECGSNITWTLNGDGKLTLTGTGSTWDFSGNNPSFITYADKVKEVSVGEGITGLNAYLFYRFDYLQSVSLPSSLTSLGRACFFGCSSLTEITIPSSVTSLGASCFANSGLKNVTIPSGVTSVGDSCFKGCLFLKKVVFQGNAPTIGTEAFYQVTAEVTYSTNLTGWNTAANQNYGGTLTWLGKSLATPVLTSVSNAATGVSVKWNAVENAEKYRVFYRTNAGGWTKAADVTGTSYTVTGLNTNWTYWFTVRCITADGKSYTSAYNTTGLSICYQGTPKLVSVGNSSNGIAVKWEAVQGAVNYRVFYKTNTGSWTKAGDTTGTTYTVTGLNNGWTYWFTVRPISADGKSYTGTYNGTGLSCKVEAFPELVSAVTAPNGVTVNWKALQGAVNYRVFYKTTNGSWTKAADTTGTSYTVTGLNNGWTYWFTVRAVSADGKTYTSNYDTAGLSCKFVGTPKLVSATTVADGVNVKWEALKNASKYRVFYKTNTGSWTKAGDTTGTSYTVTGLTNGWTYGFTVRAISADGKTYESNYDTKGLTCKYVGAPKLISASAGAGEVIVRWNTLQGAAKYRVYYKTSGGSWTNAGETYGNAFIVTGLSSGETYWFTVRAISADCSTNTSNYNTTGLKATVG